MMTASDTLQNKAGLYLCLAHAFRIPSAPGTLAALRDALPLDLEVLAADCAYPVAGLVQSLSASMQALTDEDLLVIYARLFLMPGAKHPSLNVGAYIDGAVAGGSVSAIETCYERCGLAKHDGFGDLPDHVSLQLEFVAWLFAAEAEALSGGATPPVSATEFIHTFVARWAGPFAADIVSASERFGLAAHPYATLAAILEAAVAVDAAPMAEQAVASRVDPEIARLRAQFAGRMMTADDLAEIRARLAADGLPSDHVAIPVDERDRVMGLEAMRPPTVQRKGELFAG